MTYKRYPMPNLYSYNPRERNWFDAMIEARNENRPFSWI